MFVTRCVHASLCVLSVLTHVVLSEVGGSCEARGGPVYETAGNVGVSLLLGDEGCSASDTGAHVTLANTAAFVVDRINKMQHATGVKIGLSVFKGCGNPMGAVGGALEIALRQTECRKSRYPLGVVGSPSTIDSIKILTSALHIATWALSPSEGESLGPSLGARIIAERLWWSEGALVTLRAASRPLAELFQESARIEGVCVSAEEILGEGTELFSDKDLSSEVEVLLGPGAAISEVIKTLQGKLLVIPTDQNRSFLKDLPNGTLALLEKFNDFEQTDDLENMHISAMLHSAEELIQIGNTLLDVTDWLKAAILEHCSNQTNKICEELPPPSDTTEFKRENRTLLEILSKLGIEEKKNFFYYELVQASVNSSTNESELVAVGNYNTATDVLTINAEHGGGGNSLRQDRFTKCLQGVLHLGKCSEVKRHCLNYRESDFFSYDVGSPPSVFLRPHTWVPAALAVACMGVIACSAIITFVSVRLCKGDVMEGNPVTTVLLLVSLIVMFCTIVPFSFEFVTEDHKNSTSFADKEQKDDHFAAILNQNILCAVRIFVVTVSYTLTFSLMLSRAVMLASVGAEGGFLSHVNGYLQSTICLFMTLVQIGISAQLLGMLLQDNSVEEATCKDAFETDYFWIIISYNAFLLLLLLMVTPCIYRSQRNYMEGLLLMVSSYLVLGVWVSWICVAAVMGADTHAGDAAVPVGALGTACVVLGTVLVPRSYLIVRGIARSDLAQALPSLTSISFAPRADSNHYVSDQTIYDCVNPAMLPAGNTLPFTALAGGGGACDLPTLPMRASRAAHRGAATHMGVHKAPSVGAATEHYAATSESVHYDTPPDSPASHLSSGKVTRF